ncbi:DUF2267 domain-containing protein [Salinisphaera sp.]|uniref:DUF2267 domain-containing protein n=1 Tax=Salinisphaera sp. TaxID=1914330 RepID=UPI000C38A689|nr:DUF2267 domain-containing protein [Salinisphaera sp.]MBS63419.1 hypothetical protein [Salinisphaera sp.]
MQTDRFIAQVYDGCPQLDPDVVHQSTLITLDALCEHLPKGQTKDMASQLPDEIAEAVIAGGNRAETSDVPVSLEEFYYKLMFRTELGEADAKTLARNVARTLNDALSEGEAKNTALDLPGELADLLND